MMPRFANCHKALTPTAAGALLIAGALFAGYLDHESDLATDATRNGKPTENAIMQEHNFAECAAAAAAAEGRGDWQAAARFWQQAHDTAGNADDAARCTDRGRDALRALMRITE